MDSKQDSPETSGTRVLADIADLVDLDVRVLGALTAVFAALVLGSLVRVLSKDRDDERRRSGLASLTTWWILASLMLLCLLWRPYGAALLFAIASGLGLREYFALAKQTSVESAARDWVFLAIPVQYLFVMLAWRQDVAIWIPLFTFLLIAAWTALAGKTSGYLADVGSTCLGAFLVIFCLSHAALVMTLRGERFEPAGSAGLFLFLLLLTQLNDIAQALWGRRFGKRKVTPRVSPNKTWEGLVLGALTTILAALALAPLLTPFYAHPPLKFAGVGGAPFFCSAAAGILIAVAGFLGDITMSAIKRDAGVKDSGSLLPGQGGVLDRVDSLIFTAPLFYYFVTGLYR